MAGKLQDEIFTLRVRSSAQWTPAVRLRVERRVASADLRPQLLPVSAVLLIRRIGVVGLFDHAWESRARTRVDELYRLAARPDSGGIVQEAPAVLFADESEMLACLARAIVRGTARRDWWAAALLRKLRVTDPTPLPLLSQHPRHIPAVIAQLNSWGVAVDVVRSAGNGEISECFRAMIEEHGLSPRLTEVIRRTVAFRGTMPVQDSSVSPPGETRTLSVESIHPADAPRGPAASRPPGPWVHLTRPLPLEDLCPAGELFLGTALCTYTEPSRARSPLYARQAEQWAITPAIVVSERNQGATSDAPFQHSPHRSHADNTVRRNITREPERDLAPAYRPPLPKEMPAVPPPEVLVRSQALPSPAEQAERPALATSNATLFEWSADGAETRLGGLLYLVNVMEKLDLPDCFEESWGLATQIGSWALLELIGRALLDDDEFNEDPIWRVLARLDGREDGLPGAGFRGRSTYEIPTTWSDPTENSPTGYVVSAHEPFESCLPRLEHAGLNRALLGWLNCAMTYIRYRLSQALGLEGTTIAEALLLVRGRVFVTRTHVDFVAGLEAASARVRASGLDFNPGWSPRMGRIVMFHFG